MKNLKILVLLLLSVVGSAYSQPPAKKLPVKNACSQQTIDDFKAEYVKLQNALKYDGEDAKIDKGLVKAGGNEIAKEASTSPGKEVEQQIYNQYKNALIKVAKIYQRLSKQPTDLNNDEKLAKDNKQITNFFKAIDSSLDPSTDNQLDFKDLLVNLKKAEVKGFELNPEDIYLLQKLMAHSQDRICTLQKYLDRKQLSKNDKTPYLEKLRADPINKMILSLKKLKDNENLKLADQEITISQAVKDSMGKLRAIVKDKTACQAFLKNNSAIFGEKIQTCNYEKFMQTISSNDYNQIEAILHFINANQKVEHGHTSLDWIDSQFKNEEPKPTCYTDPNNHSVYVQNIPFTKDRKKIDPAKIKCSDGDKDLEGDDCISKLNFNYADGVGFQVSSKKSPSQNQSKKITKLTISGGENCNDLDLNPKLISPASVTCSDGATALASDPSKCECTVKDKILDPSGLKCIDKPAAVTCTDGATALANDPSKCECTVKDKILDPSGLKCIDKTTDPKAECQKKIDADLDPDTGRFLNTWKWNAEKKTCDKKSEPKISEDDNALDDTTKIQDYPNKTAPGRFQPVTIPVRQMWILPGMP